MSEESRSLASMTWNRLNERLMETTDEAWMERLIKLERAGKNRKMFVERIHSRLTRVRNQREKRELREAT